MTLLYTGGMLQGHGLLSVKGVFLRSVTIKNITPLLHSSSLTDSINPSLLMLTLKVQLFRKRGMNAHTKSGFGLRDEAAEIFEEGDLPQKSGTSSR